MWKPPSQGILHTVENTYRKSFLKTYKKITLEHEKIILNLTQEILNHQKNSLLVMKGKEGGEDTAFFQKGGGGGICSLK